MKFQLEAGWFWINVSLTHTDTEGISSIHNIKVNPVIQMIIGLVYKFDFFLFFVGREKYISKDIIHLINTYRQKLSSYSYKATSIYLLQEK